MSAKFYVPSEVLVTQLEGGYVNSPKDPGGATFRGVTLRAYQDFTGHACSIAELKALTPGQVSTFYHDVYWPSVQGDALPAGVDLMLFDAAVNCGRGRAVTFLQQALGLNDVDGELGPVTFRALTAQPSMVDLIGEIRIKRATYYHSLPGFADFGHGWLSRLATIGPTAQAWARKTITA